MNQAINEYWKIKIACCKKSLENNNFNVFTAEDTAKATQIVLEDIFPGTQVQSIAWGDSLTLEATGIQEVLRTYPNISIIETFDSTIGRKELMERRRQALLVDLFITGTNALTETGKLLNLDMVGNRVAPIVFGPKHVILLIGRNKIVADIEGGMQRIKHYAAPANAIRHKTKTPCIKTSHCHDCKSPERICNTWTITEKSYPKGRINIVLINEDLGL